MKSLYRLAQMITPVVPRTIRDWVRLHIPLTGYDQDRRQKRNPFAHIKGEEFTGSSVRLGIIEEVSHAHKYYIAACREMNVSYKIINLLADDWIVAVMNSKCDAFLVWPSSCSTIYKALFDSRLKILEEDMGQTIFPTWKECWLTEQKPRLRDWMLVHDIPHPRSWVAYRKSDAMKMIDKMNFPVVGKSATGASGKGVRILKNKTELHKYIRCLFGRGISLRGFDPRDPHRGYVFLQEYIPGIEEWRMVRIGESYFGHKKGTSEKGMHSGASHCCWEDPGEEKLNMLKRITDLGGFRSMDVDLFVTPDGRILVNELQTTFGCSVATTQLKIDGVEGRYVNDGGRWTFEAGAFCQNHVCNLRVQHLLSQIKGL